jgi:hypothetical protein
LFVEIARTLRSKLGNNARSSGDGQCGAPNVHPVAKSSSVAGAANLHTPAQGILAVAAVMEIALSAQPVAGKTWRRGKNCRYNIWSGCYSCSPHHGILTCRLAAAE